MSKSNSKNKKGWIVLFIVFLVCLIACIGIIIYYNHKLKIENLEFANLEQYRVEQVENIEEKEEVEVEESTEIEEVDVEEYISPVDFESLRVEVNKDIYAWIKVEGTNIDYPVLQHDTDDAYYLTHNLDGSVGYPGCIYTEHWNNRDFKDRVTVLYGHNMKNGSMFADLHKFNDRDFFDEHDTIEIYLPDEKKVYKIVGAYYTNNKRITTYYKTMTKEGAYSWIDTISEVKESDRDHLRGTEYSKDADFIVLETCVGKNKEYRLIVVGVS